MTQREVEMRCCNLLNELERAKLLDSLAQINAAMIYTAVPNKTRADFIARVLAQDVRTTLAELFEQDNEKTN